jgi:hypothetical protein
MGFEIEKREQPHPSTPNAYVRIGSRTLAEFRGGDGAVECARQVVAALGGEIVGDVVSRVDACLDLVDVRIGYFSKLYFADHWVSRSRHDSCYRVDREATGMTFGKGDIMLRIYEKVIELREKGDEVKAVALLNALGLQAMPEHWTRIEFQLRREALKSFQVSTWADWQEKRASIVRYLSTEWFRFLREGSDHRHSDRAATHDLWDLVGKAFEEAFGIGRQVERVYEHGKATLSQLRKQAIGVLLSMAAMTETFTGQVSDLWSYLHGAVNELMVVANEGDLLRKWFERVNRHHARDSGVVVPDRRRPGEFTMDEWAAMWELGAA